MNLYIYANREISLSTVANESLTDSVTLISGEANAVTNCSDDIVWVCLKHVLAATPDKSKTQVLTQGRTKHTNRQQHSAQHIPVMPH